MKIIRAIISGEPDLNLLADFRNMRCKSALEAIRAALVANDCAAHFFALAQSLELYNGYKAKIEAWDHRLEATVAALKISCGEDPPKVPKARLRGRQVNAPAFDGRAALYRVLGTDLTQIHGLGPSLAMKLVAERGTDLRAWRRPSISLLGCAWRRATRSPAASRCLPGHAAQRAGQRRCSGLRRQFIGRSDTALGAFFRRLPVRSGKQKAVKATARKIAVLFYNAIRHGLTCQDQGEAAYGERHRQCILANLQRRARI